MPWSWTALILIVARLCEPSSELRIAEHCYRQIALSGLLVDRVDDNRQFRGSDKLLPRQPELVAFPKQRFGELFAIEYDLLLDELAELRSINVILPTQDGRELCAPCANQPTDHQQILLQHLDLELPTGLQLAPT